MCLRSQGASSQCLFGAPQGGVVLTITALRGSEPLAVFPPLCPDSHHGPLALTWSLDCDLELPAASTLGEHLEVSHLFDTHALGLQAPPRGAAGVRVTGWEREEG